MERTADDLRADILALVEAGAPRIFVSIEDYELIIADAPMAVTSHIVPKDLFSTDFIPTAYGRPIEWRMFYHGPPTATEPERRKPNVRMRERTPSQAVGQEQMLPSRVYVGTKRRMLLSPGEEDRLLARGGTMTPDELEDQLEMYADVFPTSTQQLREHIDALEERIRHLEKRLAEVAHLGTGAGVSALG